MPLKTAKTHTASKAEAAADAEVQEATEAAAPVAVRADQTYYVSAREEVSAFPVKVAGTDYSPSWDKAHKRLVWRIPHELAERFEMHSHFTSGRIIRAKE